MAEHAEQRFRARRAVSEVDARRGSRAVVRERAALHRADEQLDAVLLVEIQRVAVDHGGVGVDGTVRVVGGERERRGKFEKVGFVGRVGHASHGMTAVHAVPVSSDGAILT